MTYFKTIYLIFTFFIVWAIKRIIMTVGTELYTCVLVACWLRTNTL